ncbi:MAG TPA: TetR family transcriptional regulator [Actinomycetota bacterium]|nr:TetR family transcriptional regulator [Actinomycetota bacterium]
MDSTLGLRERKKLQTRQSIGEAALKLFAERGFDAVTVAEIARAADVSEATVFNYFPTKESLVYSQMQAFEASLLDAVATRPEGESVLEAFRRVVRDGTPRLGEPEVGDVIALAGRLVGGSAALQARERQIVAEYTDRLAQLIAAEGGSSALEGQAWVVANALMGAQRQLVAFVRANVQEGLTGPPLARAARAEIKRLFGPLERGLASYGAKRPAARRQG